VRAAGVPEAVEVWQGADRLWRYRYVHHMSGVIIRSNRSFLTRQEARGSAELAYPGVPVVELSEPPFAPRAQHRLRKLATATVVTTGTGLVVAGAVKLLLFVRRVAKLTKRLGNVITFAANLRRRDR
jgi:hypothetical protein